MSIKVITIDFWNTVFDSSNGKERNEFRVKSLSGHLKRVDNEISNARLTEALQASWRFFNKIWKEETQTPLTSEIVQYIWNYLDLPDYPDMYDSIEHDFSNCVLDIPPKLITGVRETLDKLSKNYQLAIVSDTGFSPGIVLRELLKKEEIFNYFSAFSFSDETGFAKPHQRTFMAVLDELKCSPKHAIHVGDIEETDILGAKHLGMKAIKFNGDLTSIYTNGKSKGTVADAESGDWIEVVGVIEKLDK